MRHLKVFTASWCAPCKVLAPVLDQLALEGIRIERFDINDDHPFTITHGIRSVPTIKLYDKDGIRNTVVGTMSLVQLREFAKS